MDDLEDLVGEWLTLPDVAERLDTDVSRVRRMVDDKLLVAVRRGERNVLSVPAALVDPAPMPELPGTVTVLADSGFSTAQTLRWLFTPTPPCQAPRSRPCGRAARRRSVAGPRPWRSSAPGVLAGLGF